MNQITKTLAISIATLAVGVVSASAGVLPQQNCSYSFSQNLKFGSVSSEVMDLQKVLNMYPQTQVAQSGAGSPGMETMKFGPATRAAVVRFQELNASDVLAPAGLTRGTGNVYALTRAALNQLCNGNGNTSNNTGNTNNGGTTVSGPVSVSLASNQPMSALISGQYGANLATFSFSGNGTVTKLKFMRTGISTNDTPQNVYLYDGAVRLTDASSAANDGSIVFNAPAGLFTVNGSRNITVKADIVSGLTSSQTLGVALVGVSTMGSSDMASMNVQGNQQSVSNITLAGFTMNSQTVSTNANLTAPQVNYPVWSSSVSVSQRAVNLKAVTFKRVGSAQDNALSNVTLYVDGSSVGTAMADANGRYTFTPSKILNTGSHTVEVRADVVGGATRNFYFTIENAADISAEDSSFAGVNVPVTNYSTHKTAGTQTVSAVSNSSVTVSADPSFQTTNVVTGASNQTIAKYTVTAYGEDTKVQYLTITASSTGLSNVGIYVNGAQVGSNYSIASGAAVTQQYSLGSNFIAMAGQSNVVEVRADLTSSAGVNATGYVSSYVSAMQVYGQSSQNTYSPTFSPSVKSLTIGGGTPTVGKTVGAVSSNVSANSNNIKIGSFSIQGGSVEAITVKSITLYLTAGGSMNLNNVTNVTLKDEGGNTLGTPVGVSSASQVYTVNFPVAIGQTKRIDVFANIGAASNGNTVVASSTVSYTGNTSNQSGTASATGDTATVASILVGNPTVSSKVAAKYVLGGTSQQVVVFNVTSQNGASTVNDLTFTVTGSGVQSLTIGNSSASVIGSTATFTGINMAVPAGNSGINLPVTVNYTPAYVSNGTGVVSGSTNSLTLSSFKYTDASGNVTSSTTLPSLTSNTMTLVASLPTVAAVANSGTNVGVGTTANVKIGSITVAADRSGDIVVGKLSYSLSGPGTVTASAVKVNGSTAQDKSGVAGTVAASDVTFTNGYRITAGTSVTFDIYGTVVNGGTVNGNTSVTLGAVGSFKWSDNASTAGTALDATLLGTNYAN